MIGLLFLVDKLSSLDWQRWHKIVQPTGCLTTKEELMVTELLAYLKASTKWASQRFQCSFVQDENACIQIFCSYIFNSKILLLNCDWSLPPLSLSLFLSLSSTHTRTLSLNFFRRSILTLHIFNSQALSRITRTSEWARENEKEKNGRESERVCMCTVEQLWKEHLLLDCVQRNQTRIYFSCADRASDSEKRVSSNFSLS